MQQNLSRLKELQREKEESVKLVEDVIVEANVIQPIVKIDEPKDITISCDSPFTITYEKVEEDIMLAQKRDFLESINQISKYSNHLFIKYLGVEAHQYKDQPIIKKADEKEKKDAKKENEKKTQKKDQPVKKQEVKIEAEKKEGDKKQEIKENVSALIETKIKLKIFTQERLQKLDYGKFKKQIKSKSDFIERFNLCFEVLFAVSSLHDLQYTIYPNNLEDLIFLKNNSVKLAIHNAKLWRMVTQEQLNETKTKQSTKFKKQSMINPSVKYSSPEFVIKSITLKDVRYNDIWKTGVFLLTLLTGEDLTKDLLALEAFDEAKIKQHKLIDEAKTLKLKKYLHAEYVTQILKLVSIMPSQRPQLKGLRQLFKKIKAELNEFLDEKTLQLAKAQYAKERSEKSFKFLPELKANQEILTADHRKKLSEYFKTVQSRPVKDFKLQYRASQTQFSCKSFYQVAFQKKNLLIVFCEKTNNKKIICYSEEAFDLSKCIGIFGGFIKDTKKLSFIFSPQENEFCKLKNADRAIGVSHTQGPIIGDGDFVISDGGLHNICRFPSSYESLKLKKLLKTQRFELLEYDVYQVMF